ncbi:N-formylglutamate amidohydrolase [Mesorhizobium sp.]|uniref:N-formylglutamate amidohydrolase n=1 Tax=Mesorhizobium sp. TaxID=1871066 RepID=UPI000FE9A27F|nr:N-formylglutamate amidohydrolase [Mesorhizobium sp.]RWM30682.1 MAG: N-formylglutamate amidohydrolase [Mesorhizobium sp.]RWM42012.1 MAG: N-formylglutamate amidohydrolase [Mesorhizobium sp.]TJV50650.1 MAG: N-formylglutamate amidohydrolase [Mesorhizobium sp.]
MAVLRDDAVLLPGSFKLKTAAEDFSVVPPFEIRLGAEQRVPFLFNSPHSGRHYPERFLAMARLDRNAIRRSEDCYVEELFGGAVALGAPMLAANFPRAYLDVNREPWELDPRMFAEPVPSFCNIRSARVAGGLGTVPKLVGEGLDIYPGRLPLAEAVGRIEAVYKPYHETLKRLLTRTHARFGYAVLIDCHSMPASIRVGDNGVRPDFIIGDRFGISAAAALTETAIGLLTGMGYAVAHNKPYAGGFITEHYGRPARHLHALQIEVNRGLYMNERTFQRSAGFDALADDLTRFSAELVSMPDHHFVDLPLAAE